MGMSFNKTSSENFVFKLSIDVCDAPLLAVFESANRQDFAVANGDSSGCGLRRVSGTNTPRREDHVPRQWGLGAGHWFSLTD
jgi:hypothetical protein